MSEIQTMQVTTTTTTTTNNNNTQTNHSWILHLKIITMLLLILLDIAINSTEYDTFSQSDKRNRQIQLLIFIAQLVLHIIACSILIIASCQTFLFQVGLIGIVLKDFAHVIVMLSLYFGLSVVSGTFRWALSRNADTYLWDQPSYLALSSIQKIAAPIYYAFNLRALIQLENPKYHDKQEWVRIVKGNEMDEASEELDIHDDNESDVDLESRIL